MGIAFLKGHGTQNDFVVLPDPDAGLDLTPDRVRALCDRRRGLGADGVLRVVRTQSLPAADTASSTGEWFMDYRNADGSIAEMCGNGVRVFARYLVDAGLVTGTEFDVGSRAGDRPVVVHPDGTVTVGMGPAEITGKSTVTLDGVEADGIAVDVGNPHLVVFTESDIRSLDLREQPGYDHDYFPSGVNIEFLNRSGEDTLRMRVYERGVGETRACGTGTVAAVAADLHAAGRSGGRRVVHVPGGSVTVTVEPGASTLTGPAVLLASGELDAQWWREP